MKVILTGANGQLGRELTKKLSFTELLAPSSYELDITDINAVGSIIHAFKPDIVIHGAAYTKVDAAEQQIDLAWRINAVGTQNIALACRQVQAAMVYISSDYVFDGALGRSYTEFDLPNPLGVYGKSKHAGEVLARQITDRLYVLRTAWLYGDGQNFVRTMVKLGEERDELQVVDDQYGSPTSTVDLAEAVLRIMETGRYGTYHVVNSGVTSWCGFAKKIFDLTGNTRVKLNAVTTEQFSRPAPRPAYSPLDTRLLRLTLGWSPRPWEEALTEYLGAEGLLAKGGEPA